MATLIAHTGYGEEEHLQRAKEAGFDHHLVKPADLSRAGEIGSLCRDRDVRYRAECMNGLSTADIVACNQSM
jgi:CheY-like chemotaxis protein